jgi:uncharacterized lipoprotein YbaY
MRAPLILALSLVLGLAACNNQQPPPPPPPAPVGPAPVPADATAVRGQLAIEGLTDLPRGLNLRLRLLDMSDPSIVPPVLAERVEPAPSSLPYRYALPYEAAVINPDGRYVIEATLLADQFVMYGTPQPAPVLTNGGSDSADLALTRGGSAAPDIAPAEQLKREFDSLESSIGGMQRTTGERIEDKLTVGWDAFTDSSGVRFAREMVDAGDAGTTSYRYAYRNGEPWVLAREQGGTLALVGWGEDGGLLLNRVGEANGGLDEAEINRLRSRAVELHKIASRKR